MSRCGKGDEHLEVSPSSESRNGEIERAGSLFGCARVNLSEAGVKLRHCCGIDTALWDPESTQRQMRLVSSNNNCVTHNDG